MDKALVFGTKDCRFESCQGHAHRQKVAAGGNQARAPFVPRTSSTVFDLACASACMSRGRWSSEPKIADSSPARFTHAGRKWLPAGIKRGLLLHRVLHQPSLALCAQVHVARPSPDARGFIFQAKNRAQAAQREVALHQDRACALKLS